MIPVLTHFLFVDEGCLNHVFVLSKKSNTDMGFIIELAFGGNVQRANIGKLYVFAIKQYLMHDFQIFIPTGPN